LTTAPRAAQKTTSEHFKKGRFWFHIGSYAKRNGRLPAAVQEELSHRSAEFLAGNRVPEIGAWAVHPGGRTVLDAVEHAFELPADALTVSRDILRRYGNMSSATVMFVLKAIMDQAPSRRVGCAMAFGPGLVAETMLFRRAA
jgi:predicted naringenin-chalcone synthase